MKSVPDRNYSYIPRQCQLNDLALRPPVNNPQEEPDLMSQRHGFGAGGRIEGTGSGERQAKKNSTFGLIRRLGKKWEVRGMRAPEDFKAIRRVHADRT